MRPTEGLTLKRQPIRCSIVDIKDVHAEDYQWALWGYYQYRINHPILARIKEFFGYIEKPVQKEPKYVEVSRIEL